VVAKKKKKKSSLTKRSEVLKRAIGKKRGRTCSICEVPEVVKEIDALIAQLVKDKLVQGFYTVALYRATKDMLEDKIIGQESFREHMRTCRRGWNE